MTVVFWGISMQSLIWPVVDVQDLVKSVREIYLCFKMLSKGEYLHLALKAVWRKMS